MFIGQHSHTIDDKGRLSVPAKYRARLSSQGVVVTRGIDSCLWLYPKEEWTQLADTLSQLPLTNRQSRAFTRLMLAGAWDAELDGQGRLILPQYLRTYAGITKHVIVAGLNKRLEIWDEEKWASYIAEVESESDTIAEGISELGL